MLSFNQLVKFISICLILLTLLLVVSLICNKPTDSVSNIKTITKRDTITIYKYGTGNAQKVIRQVLHLRDTVIIRDTSIRFRDSNLNLIITNPCGDTPFVEYRIKERKIIDSIIIKAPDKNFLSIGMIGSKNTFTPALTYSTKNCNYFIGYDVINKNPSFGILFRFTNIARSKD
jgi:hypothetical protein